MSSKGIKFYSQFHIIGLGGTGANVVTTFLRQPVFKELLFNIEDFRPAFLAIDIADGDIMELKDEYNRLLEEMRRKGIPLDRLYLRALTIKFPSPDILFDFMSLYPDYLLKEGIKTEKYRSWITLRTKIPSLAGGAGRQRALAKAVYALNYYHFGQLNTYLNEFRDKVLSSPLSPIVYIIFGLGGGTGSGVVFDIGRHLREKLGSGVPLVLLSVLPATLDDSLAKGASPYQALQEMRCLFDHTINRKVIERFGEKYRNPFSLALFIPLQAAVTYTKEGTLEEAKRHIDDAIVEMIKVLSSFDLADMVATIGSSAELRDSFMNVAGILKIRFPVDEYIELLRMLLNKIDLMNNLFQYKIQLIEQAKSIMDKLYSELYELLRSHVTENRLDVELEKYAEDIVRRGGRFDIELSENLKAFENTLQAISKVLLTPLRATRFEEDTMAASYIRKYRECLDYALKPHKNYSKDFGNRLQQFEKELSLGLETVKELTWKQKAYLGRTLTLLKLVDISINFLQRYLRTRYLAEELRVLYAKTSKEVSDVFEGALELSIALYKLVSTILEEPTKEAKMIDPVLTSLVIAKRRFEDRKNTLAAYIEALERSMAERKESIDQLREKISRIRIDLSGKKKRLRAEISDLEEEISKIKSELDYYYSKRSDIEYTLKTIDKIIESLEINSDYRNTLNSIARIDAEYTRRMSEATRSTRFFERVIELTEEERLRILGVIMREEEEKLRDPSEVKNIINMARLRDILKSHMKTFSVPGFFGLKDNYRSDVIWAIVATPIIWDKDLEESLRNSLAIYALVEAGIAINIRPIEPVDPWTIEFLIICAKAKPEHLEIYDTIRFNAYQVIDRTMFMSFLLEQGVDAVKLYTEAEKTRSKTAMEV
ncbi:MAG: hypothetical protein DRJ47_00700 [Thermoprotei archaeon]|nr:MAG: hypothetical protein DRJ47_00700 [Thermoprotei archaeon]